MIVKLHWQNDMIFNFYSFGADRGLHSFIFQVLHGFIYPLSPNKPMRFDMLIGLRCFSADKSCQKTRGLNNLDV
jgi:hypothetical protein